jgi:reverse gyrase
MNSLNGEKKKLFFLSSSTGSGKTRSILFQACFQASKGFVSVVAFPSKNLKNLLEQESINLKLIAENSKDIEFNIHTLDDALTAEQILQIFMKGKSILLTLRSYSHNRFVVTILCILIFL